MKYMLKNVKLFAPYIFFINLKYMCIRFLILKWNVKMITVSSVTLIGLLHVTQNTANTIKYRIINLTFPGLCYQQGVIYANLFISLQQSCMSSRVGFCPCQND